MKKYLFVSFLLFLFLVNIQFVKADCESAIKDSEKIKVSRIEEFSSGDDDDLYKSYIGLEISNIPDNLYVVITNDYNSDSVTINSSDLVDGVYRYPAPYIYRIVNYKVNVYSKDESCTSTDSIRVFDVSTRIVNEYFFHNKCLDNRDLEICQPVLDSENVSTTEFNKQIDEAIRLRDRTFIERVWDFFKTYYLYILIPFLLISIISIVRIVILKRRQKNE